MPLLAALPISLEGKEQGLNIDLVDTSRISIHGLHLVKDIENGKRGFT